MGKGEGVHHWGEKKKWLVVPPPLLRALYSVRPLDQEQETNHRNLLGTSVHTSQRYWLTIYPRRLMAGRHYLLIFAPIGPLRSKALEPGATTLATFPRRVPSRELGA